MSLGLVVEKCGTSRVFLEKDGSSVPVTVVKVLSHKVAQVKTREKNGYRAVQCAIGSKHPSKLTKAVLGEFIKQGIEPAKGLKEFRLEESELPEVKVGDEFNATVFNEGQLVDVRGLSRGKGFAGTVKRHNFRTQDASHGNSLSHRAPGSIGQCQTPGRVMKGKKMSGHMGDVFRTSQALTVVRVDVERNLLLIKGAVPGAPGTELVVSPSVKAKRGSK
jgi:large subunit ribosomal protein L3